jgi:coenzyme F420-0:L-glutamate ligase / coenzyme F420-1:gamma-L-glutamate ligase
MSCSVPRNRTCFDNPCLFEGGFPLRCEKLSQHNESMESMMNPTKETPLYFEWMAGRRSIRLFRPDAVPQDVIERILEAACLAPSAHNRQPWRFVLLSRREDRGTLAEILTARMRAVMEADQNDEQAIVQRAERTRRRWQEAPLAVLVCGEDPHSDSCSEDSQRGERMLLVQSVAAAIGYLLLAAHGEGLGACWIGYPAFCPAPLFRELGLPARWEPQAAVLLGYPAEQPVMQARLPLDQIVIKLNPGA